MHFPDKCPAASSLFFQACTNAMDSTATEKMIREMGRHIFPIPNVEPGVTVPQPALTNFIFNVDPCKRSSMTTAEELEKENAVVPMSLVRLMREFHLVTDDTRTCFKCHQNASILYMKCDIASCNVFAHPECINLACTDKAKFVTIENRAPQRM